jgi:hypothetical protein
MHGRLLILRHAIGATPGKLSIERKYRIGMPRAGYIPQVVKTEEGAETIGLGEDGQKAHSDPRWRQWFTTNDMMDWECSKVV